MDECMSHACVFELQKRFCNSQVNVEDDIVDAHEQQEVTQCKIQQIIQKDDLCIKMIAEMVSIIKVTVGQISH